QEPLPVALLRARSNLEEHEGRELSRHRDRDRLSFDLALVDGLSAEILRVEEPKPLARLEEGRDLELDCGRLRPVIDRDVRAIGIVVARDEDGAARGQLAVILLVDHLAELFDSQASLGDDVPSDLAVMVLGAVAEAQIDAVEIVLVNADALARPPSADEKRAALPRDVSREC